MQKNRKSSNKSPTNLQKKKSVPILSRMSTKSHKYLLSKSRNTLEQTGDTFLGSKLLKCKRSKQGLTNDSSSAQITQHTLIHQPKLLENRLMTQCQNRFSNQDKSHSQKQKSLIKTKPDQQKKIKSRLSLNDKKRKIECNDSFQRYYETENIAGVNLQQFTKERQSIQKQLKKLCKKTKIEKKDLLKVSGQYERLLDRFIFTQITINQPFENDRLNYITKNVSCFKDGNSCQEQNSIQQTENRTENKVESKTKKVKLLQLNNLKKLGIKDYNDEFMSHYEQLSQSWKRDIDIQKRF